MRHFFSLVCLLACTSALWAGPLLERFRQARGARCVRLSPRPATTYPNQSGLCVECKPEELAVQQPSSELPKAEQPSLQQDIVLDPRPGTGLPSKPGTLTPKVPESLLPSKVTIDHGPEVKKISESLLSMGGKLDTWLPLLLALLGVSTGVQSLPLVAQAGSGLLRLIRAALAPPAPPKSGQPASASPVSPGAD